MTADDILITGPDSAQEGMAYALASSGLPTDPRKVVGRKFLFFSRNVGESFLLLSGTIASIRVQKEKMLFYIAGPSVFVDFQDTREYLDHFSWNGENCWAITTNPASSLRGWSTYLGEFTLLDEK